MMAKSMAMDTNMICKKTTDRKPSTRAKVVLICKSFKWKNPSYNSLKKEMMLMVIKKEGDYTCDGGMMTDKLKMMREKSKKSNLMVSTREKPPFPAWVRLLGLISPFVDCATMQDLNSSCTVVIIVAVVAAAFFVSLLENLKLWKWLKHQLIKVKKSCVKRKDRVRDGKSLSRGVKRKGTWMEDILSSLDVSGVDDLFISICILIGLGILCGFFVLFRRYNGKNVRESRV